MQEITKPLTPSEVMNAIQGEIKRLGVKKLTAKQTLNVINGVENKKKKQDKKIASEFLALTQDQKPEKSKVLKLDHEGSLSINQLKKYGVPDMIPCDFSKALTIIPRKAQKDTFSAIFPRYRSGERKYVVGISTGVGKTIFAIILARFFLERNTTGHFVFCVHRKSLLLQTKLEFEEKLGVNVGIIQGNGRLNLECQIQISMVQTMGNRLDAKQEFTKKLFNELFVRELIIDECHINFKSTEKLVKNMEERFSADESYIIVGLTGTPYASFLAKLYGNKALVKVSDMHKSIEEGVIVDYHLICYEEKIDTSKLKENSVGGYENEGVTAAVEELILIGEPAQKWWDDDMTRGKYTLVFCQSIKEAVAIHEHFIEWAEKTGNVCPSRIVLLHSKLGDAESAAIMSECVNGDALIVISVYQISTGFNAPHFSVRLNFRPFAPHPYLLRCPAAMMDYVQVCARTARSFDGGVRCIDIETGKSILFDSDTVISDQYVKVETLPKKEYAVHRDYTGIGKFMSPQDVDAMFNELPQPLSRKEKKDKIDEAEQAMLDMLENDAKELPPKTIACPSCGSNISPPHCGDCGYTIEKVASDIIEGVEIRYVDGVAYVAHTPKKWSKKLEARAKERKKQDKERERVNWGNITEYHLPKVGCAIFMLLDEDGHLQHSNVDNKFFARLFDILGENKPLLANGDVDWGKMRRIKDEGKQHLKYCEAEFAKKNVEPFLNMKKYRLKAKQMAKAGLIKWKKEQRIKELAKKRGV